MAVLFTELENGDVMVKVVVMLWYLYESSACGFCCTDVYSIVN